MKIFFESMITRMNIIHFIVVILWQQIALGFVNGVEEMLETTLEDGETKIHLKWHRTQQLLANVHVPVWLVNAFYGTAPLLLSPNYIEDNIGEFVMYHDLTKSSAVVYFKKFDALYGMVDTRYLIDGIPMSQLHLIHPIGPYVKMALESIDYASHIKPVNSSILYNEEYLIDRDPALFPNSLPPIKRFRPDLDNQQGITNLYPEVLIIVPYDVTKLTRSKGPNYIEIIIRDHIIMFNAIDMMMAKLSTRDIKIYLNIAGIIIDQNDVIPLPMIHPQDQPTCSNCLTTVHAVDTNNALFHFETFLRTHKGIFVADSFDFYYASTTKSLSFQNLIINGISKVFDTYKQRVYGEYFPQLQGVFVHRGNAYDHVVAAHEIGHLLGLGHDTTDSSLADCDEECSTVMKPRGKYCPQCLKWSATSAKQLQNFVRIYRNHCFFLNKPRSLHPHGWVMKTLSPTDQCRCYGFEPRASNKDIKYLDVIPPSQCRKKLICAISKLQTPKPLDGTPCGYNKACWHSKCKKIKFEL